MKQGFITLHKRLLGWEWYSDSNTKSLFLHCLLKANYQDKEWRGMIIQRGSFVTSLGKLSEETGMSKQNIRTALKHLKDSGELTQPLTQNLTRKATVITVCKYDTYQFTPSEEQHSSQHGANTESNTATNTEPNTEANTVNQPQNSQELTQQPTQNLTQKPTQNLTTTNKYINNKNKKINNAHTGAGEREFSYFDLSRLGLQEHQKDFNEYIDVYILKNHGRCTMGIQEKHATTLYRIPKEKRAEALSLSATYQSQTIFTPKDSFKVIGGRKVSEQGQQDLKDVIQG